MTKVAFLFRRDHSSIIPAKSGAVSKGSGKP